MALPNVKAAPNVVSFLKMTQASRQGMKPQSASAYSRQSHHPSHQESSSTSAQAIYGGA
jgi:hypothetical protein